MKPSTILRAFKRAYDGKDVFDPEPAFWRAVKHRNRFVGEKEVQGETMGKISREEMKRLNQRIKEREKKMRARFPEIHGKKLDYVEMDSDGGYVCVTIRFTDKTDFYIQFRQRDPKLDWVQYNDISTGNSQRIRTYVGKEKL